MFDLGLLVLLAATVVPVAVAARRVAGRAGLPPEVGTDLAWSVGAAFVIGARVAWLAINPAALTYLVDVIRLTQGLVVPAGVAAGVGAVAWYARRHSLAPLALAAPGTVVALVATAGWHAVCPWVGRCGGAPATVVAVVAAALALWVWFGVRPDGGGAPRALVAAGVALATVAVAAAFRLRLAPWPTASDVVLLLEGAALAGVGARLRRRSRARSEANESH